MSDDQAQTDKEDVQVVKEAKEEKLDQPKEGTKTAKVSKKLEDLMSQIEKLSVLELSQFVHALEEKFGVSASAAVALTAQAAATPGAADGEAPDEGQTTFNVILAESGANKISVIKAVRELVPTLGLKEAKDLVDAPPKPILEGVNKENAQEAKQKLEAAGAKVELK